MSKILKSVHMSAQLLDDTGRMNELTIGEFDAFCLNPCPQFTAMWREFGPRIAPVRGVFAAFLNVGKTTITAREQGTKKPSWAASKLLAFVDRKGLDVLA
jgi:putative transcriptional regulator